MAGPEGHRVEPLTEAQLPSCRAALVALLRDVVDGGASVGFLPPLAETEAGTYWDSVAGALRGGGRRLWIARGPGDIIGTVQLDLAGQVNGRHRAEVIRLMVHRRARQQGIGRALMEAAETEARRLGRTTLVLDTRQGDPSERLYRKLGWQLGGTIPRYARSADGTLHTTAFYYKLL
ncbi:MAG TPA: GNAT family N-acetyltransferase [Methylomirabilota bacterium]|jgi:ribosomal protein S18 acetylase RimI-like enzyme|nr:GNAT family N-acetyltransferase [Methylomirabilota bacterium]